MTDHVTDRDGRSGGNRERRRGDYDASDEHRTSRNRDEGYDSRDAERFRAPGSGMSRNERRGVPYSGENTRPREKEEWDREAERMDERRRPRRERNEEEDISNYEYVNLILCFLQL